MSSGVKALDNQAKHLTKAEMSARSEAEASVMPDREVDFTKPIKGVTGTAATYWRRIVQRLDGLSLLDELDKEAFGIYCQKLARRDRLQALCDRLLKNAAKADASDDDTAGTDKLDGLMRKLDALERDILSYADKLGFTPQARVRLAQKRAAAAAVDQEESDLFGDG